MAETVTPLETPAPEATAARAASARRTRRGWAARIAVAAGSFCIMAGVLLLGVFLLLSRGPVAMPFLNERVAVALEARIGSGIDIDVGETRLEKTAHGLEVHVYHVVFKDAAGKEIMRSPEAIVSFDPLQLAMLKLTPRRLALRGMVVKAEISTDGDVRISTGDARGAEAPQARLGEALGFLLAVARTGTVSGLSDVSLAEARLVIDDKRVGREIAFEQLTAVFEATTPGRPVLAGSISRNGATVPFKLETETDRDGAKLNLRLSQVPLRLAETIGGFGGLPFSGDSTVTMTASLNVGQDGAARGGEAAMRLTPGKLMVPALGGKPIAIDEAGIEVSWAGGGRLIDKIRLNYAGDGGKGALVGALHLAGPGGEHRFEARTEGLTLAPMSARDKPVATTDGRLKARIGTDLDRLILDELAIDGPETALKLSGSAAKVEGGASAKIQLAVGRMPLRTALHWWPAPVAAEGRRWLAGAIQEGILSAMTLSLDLPPAGVKAIFNDDALPADALRIDLQVEGGSLVPLDGLPPVAGLVGAGWVTSQQAQFAARNGFVDLKGGGRRLQLADGAVQLNGLHTVAPDISVGFRAQAALEHAAEFLALPALKNAFALQLNPQDVKGQFDGRVRIALPLVGALKPGAIVTEVNGTLKGVTVEKAIGRDKLENANLTVSADATGIEIKGDGRWQGMPVNVSLESDAQDKSSATVLSFTLDEAAQRRFGLSGQVSGPLPVKVKGLREDGGGLKAQAEVDLTRAAIDGLIPGFQKPASRPGRLSFDITEKPKGYGLSNIALDSGSASFRGQAEAMADGTVTSARFSLFRLSPGDNVRLDFDRTGAGGKVVIRGNNFDARPFLKAAGPSSGKNERDIDLELKTTLLSGNGGEVLTNADVRLSRRSGQMRQLNATGKLNGKAVSISGQAGDRPAPLTIESDDAGALLRYLDIYTRMVGGDLSGQIRPTARDMSGYLIAHNFSLRNEPALRRLLNEAPEGGPRAEAAAFTKMRIDFSRTGSSTTIRDAVIFGPQIGVTFNGVVDQARDRVSLSGTFIPAYGLNNAFAQIPVLGTILGGGRNEGLLAITFGVSGRASQPEVSVNPLSAVTPGIFRKIFEFRNDRTGTAVAPSPSTGETR